MGAPGRLRRARRWHCDGLSGADDLAQPSCARARTAMDEHFSSTVHHPAAGLRAIAAELWGWWTCGCREPLDVSAIDLRRPTSGCHDDGNRQ